MAPRTRTTPPPAPAANAIGVVPRWRAWAGSLAGLVIGTGVGRYGLGQTIGYLSLALFAAGLGLAVVLELRTRGRDAEFDQITTRQQVDRALTHQEKGTR